MILIVMDNGAWSLVGNNAEITQGADGTPECRLAGLIASLAKGLKKALAALFGNLNMQTYVSLPGFAAGIITAIAMLDLITEALAGGEFRRRRVK